MNDNWDSYFCTVEEKPASIVVNFGLAGEAETLGLPALCYVSIFVRNPDPSGFPPLDEEVEIATMEDALVESFHAPDAGRCAGHCLTDGRLDVFFFMESGENWPENVAAVLNRYPAHEWEAGSHDDPDWELYFGFLYPDDVSMLYIQNRRVRDQLEETGDDLSASRRMEHWIAFEERTDAEAFWGVVKDMGFALDYTGEAARYDLEEESDRAGITPDFGEEDHPSHVWRVRISRPDRPDESDEVTLLLYNVAREHNGHYQGWGCAVLDDGIQDG